MSNDEKANLEMNIDDKKLLRTSHNVINSAQKTLSDLDRSIEELSMLVDNLKKEANYLEK